MKTRTSAFLLVAATLGTASSAYAQVGAIDKPLPNVMLLVDNSGSMERMLDGSMPAKCDAATVVPPNRWGTLLQALTGSFADGFMCGKVDRSSSQFLKEYGDPLGGEANLYDARYFLPYHRPVGNVNGALCTVGPNGTDAGLVKWSDIAAGSGTPKACNDAGIDPDAFLNQATDGQLDAARPFVRLGLMTFDSAQSKSILADGMWSYPDDGSQGVLGHGQGQLPACLASDMEVGARNATAPAWEGRMIPFPTEFASSDVIDANNNAVQRTLLAARPYGATPIAGLLDDARYYFWRDKTGPQTVDSYVKGGCREQFAILLTDGAPNLDMRPDCAAGGGTCPYASPKDIAGSMFDWKNTPDPGFNGTPGGKVTTFVIGFSVNGSGGVADGFPAATPSCSAWYESVAKAQPASATDKERAQAFVNACGAAKPPKASAAAACCNLHEISVAGNGGPAFFAESQADLTKAFATILGTIARGTSTRTTPSYSAPSGTNSSSATFLASFNPIPTAPWAGDVQRSRLSCAGGTRTASPVDPTYGDDFAINLAKQAKARKRRFLIVTADGLNGVGADDEKKVATSIRPFMTGDSDGLASRKAKEVLSSNPVADLPLSSASIDKGVCKKSVDGTGKQIPQLSKSECAKAVVGFTTAEVAGLTMGSPSYDFAQMRCPGGTCSAMGAIYRSSPTVVGAPSAVLRDESYRAFADRMKSRPTALYVATIDGQLHAFKADPELQGGVAKQGDALNEMWSFIPPALYGRLDANYPRGNQILLDGTTVARDVIFERGAADVTSAGLSSGAPYEKWHTVLVGGFGVGGFGYYALDITDPGPGNFDASTGTSSGSYQPATVGTVPTPTRPTEAGPHFLWQLTDSEDDATGKGKDNGKGEGGKKRTDLFATRTPTPALTTLFFRPPSGGDLKEVAVAILPGGTSGPPASALPDCKRDDATTLVDSAFPARANVRNWGSCPSDSKATPVAGRSVMVVRVDTGEVIRVFGRELDVPARFKSQGRLGNQPVTFHAPMVGTPVVYPGGVGAIGQRAFIGDADGMIWRLDLTDPDPKNWTAKLFHDTFSPAANVAVGVYPAASTASPILLPPVLAADQDGNVMLGVATGDTEAMSPDGRNFLYSVSERTTYAAGTTSVGAKVNWFLRFDGGERVSGPMSVFDSNLFFSTFVPAPANSVCAPGQARLWGRDYLRPIDPANLALGGLRRTPTADATLDTVLDYYAAGDSFIPGVSIRSVPACGSADLGQGLGAAGASFTSGSYELYAPMSKQKVVGGVSTTDAVRVTLPLVKNQTRVDSWAAVVE